MYDHQSDDKFRVRWPFWIFPSHTFSSGRVDGGFVDYDTGGVSGYRQKNSALFCLCSPSISYSTYCS